MAWLHVDDAEVQTQPEHLLQYPLRILDVNHGNDAGKSVLERNRYRGQISARDRAAGADLDPA